MKVLVIGAAGFIGSAFNKKLLVRGGEVTGLDNINNYCDVNLKHARLANLDRFEKFTFIKTDITDEQSLYNILKLHIFDAVIDLTVRKKLNTLMSVSYAS
jgi:UDP-glucuronate 4-epimerase